MIGTVRGQLEAMLKGKVKEQWGKLLITTTSSPASRTNLKESSRERYGYRKRSERKEK